MDFPLPVIIQLSTWLRRTITTICFCFNCSCYSSASWFSWECLHCGKNIVESVKLEFSKLHVFYVVISISRSLCFVLSLLFRIFILILSYRTCLGRFLFLFFYSHRLNFIQLINDFLSLC